MSELLAAQHTSHLNQVLANLTLDGRTLYTANIGDTRAVISRKGRASRLTIDHKATEPSEIERVK